MVAADAAEVAVAFQAAVITAADLAAEDPAALEVIPPEAECIWAAAGTIDRVTVMAAVADAAAA